MSRLPLALLALGALGCKAMDPDPTLTKFADCDEMSAYMARMARQEVLYDYRWDPESFIPLFMNEYSMVAQKGDEAADTGSAGSYSTTNTQEADIDEADLMETDGQYLYTLSGNHLVISRAWPWKDAALESMVDVDGDTFGIYLYNSLVVVLSTVTGDPAPRAAMTVEPDTPEARTLVTVVDVSDPTLPVVLRETYAVGSLVQTRRIDNRLFVVTYQDINVTLGASDPREAEKRVRDADPTAWLPWRTDFTLKNQAWESDINTVCDCEDVWASDREGGSYLVTVMSTDLDDPTAVFEGDTVVGQAETVYASPDAFYIAATEYVEGPFPTIDDSLDTVIHKFAIAGDDAHPTYRATTQIVGTVSDQFGFSEYGGVLRVAATEFEDASSAVVYTLAEENGAFTELDSLGDLGEGEQIYATRFVGDMGYVVTYMEIDPLFTIDLSDPTDIRLGGELEVSGWSDYLHPMDEDHLLSVGIDEGQLAISLFDVSDIESPTLADREILPAWSSEAQEDHHAFNYFAEQNALAVPSNTSEYESVLEVLDARPEGLSYTGRISQDLSYSGYNPACAPIRRSVIMENFAYAISDAGFTVADLAAPAKTLVSVPFVGIDPCDDYDGYY